MGVIATRYITLSNRYAGYNDDGNFIQSHVIEMMIFDELKLPNIEEFVNEADITIIGDEIEEFLDKKMDEEQHGLKAMFEMEMQITDEEVDKEKRLEGMKSLLGSSRYYFEPYSLEYFKIYTSRLKEKLQSLFSVLNDINRCKSEELSEESKHQLMKDDVWEIELYPSRKIQIKDRYHAHMPQFIALSEEQQTQVQKEELENFSKWMKMDFEEDDEKISGEIPQLVKTMKNTEE